MKWKWFSYIELISIFLFLLFFCNMGMTDWSAGIVQYNGFIPQPWDVLIVIFAVFMLCFCLGAETEYIYGKKLRNGDILND